MLLYQKFYQASCGIERFLKARGSEVMRIVWVLLAAIGIITLVWYLWVTSRGRIGYPRLLWSPVGHVISWALVILGVIAVVMLLR